jgi:hypothetical protein
MKGIRAAPKAGAVLALLVVAIGASTAPSSAATRLVGNSYVLYVTPDRGNALLISGPRRVNKATYDVTKDAVAAGVDVAASPLTDRYWSAIGKIPYNGSYVEATFSDHASGGCGIWTCDDYINGESHAYWFGNSPYYATSMELADYIWEDGCAMSVSYPPGAGWSVVTSSEVKWDSGRLGNNNIWYINHYYNNIHFSTGCGRWNLTQQSSAEAWFGTSAYTTYARKSTTPP